MVISNHHPISTLYKTTILWTGPNSKQLQTTKIHVAKIMIFVFDRVENTVGKGENAGNQHFLLLQQCFQNASFSGLLKVGIVWQSVKVIQFLTPYHLRALEINVVNRLIVIHISSFSNMFYKKY